MKNNKFKLPMIALISVSLSGLTATAHADVTTDIMVALVSSMGDDADAQAKELGKQVDTWNASVAKFDATKVELEKLTSNMDADIAKRKALYATYSAFEPDDVIKDDAATIKAKADAKAAWETQKTLIETNRTRINTINDELQTFREAYKKDRASAQEASDKYNKWVQSKKDDAAKKELLKNGPATIAKLTVANQDLLKQVEANKVQSTTKVSEAVTLVKYYRNLWQQCEGGKDTKETSAKRKNFNDFIKTDGTAPATKTDTKTKTSTSTQIPAGMTF